MRGLGTIINVLAIILGSGLGLIIKQGLKKRYQEILIQACGVASIFIGLAGALPGLLYIGEDGGLVSGNIIILVISLVIGSLIGELLNIEKALEKVGEIIKQSLAKKLFPKTDDRFVEGFVTCSLVVCVGAMAIVGSLQDGLSGDYSMLLIKSVLDMVIAIVFASTLGIGVMFSALSLGLYQGGITLFAVLIAESISPELIANLSSLGSVLIFCVGINLVFGNKIRVGNMLPALLVPIVYAIFL
ncbi:MAG: DUF554 domain-containing protein [Lachnospiraceae bacterium]|nr:DUF554 domain-containing protein [Lachnospiraceae bacterium]